MSEEQTKYVPPPPPEREYRVIGPRPVHGTYPRRTFKARFTPEEEKALIDAGHLERVKPEKPKPPAKTVKSKPDEKE